MEDDGGVSRQTATTTTTNKVVVRRSRGMRFMYASQTYPEPMALGKYRNWRVSPSGDNHDGDKLSPT